jgi:hypothetical protein
MTTSPQKSGGAPSRAHRQNHSNAASTTNVNGKTYSPASPKTPEQVNAHNRAVALAWAAAGVATLPCRGAGRKVKFPHITEWQTRSTTDADVIAEWWDKWPDALPGIDLRKAGLIVVDPDRHPGGADGIFAWDLLCFKHGWDDSGQPVVSTAGDGEHYYFKQPDGEPLGNREGGLPDGVNVRGAGGLVIAPGAMLPDGRKWKTREGSAHLLEAFKAGAIPPVPDWLIEILSTRKTPKRAKNEAKPPKGGIGPRGGPTRRER